MKDGQDDKDSITITDIREGGFRTWFKCCLIISGHLGFAFGFVTLVLALSGGGANANLFVVQLRGIPAGVVNLLWCPVLALLVSIPLSVISYWPFRFFANLMSRSPGN